MKIKFFVLLAGALTAAAAVAQLVLGTNTSHLPLLPNYSKSITFKVADVKPVRSDIKVEEYDSLLHRRFVENDITAIKQQVFNNGGDLDNFVAPKLRLEAFSRDRQPMAATGNNGFFYPIFRAYSEHRPLVLSPDMVWLAIMQGFSVHVNQNAEALRRHFVQHEGKKVIEVRLDGHVQLGNDQSDWEWVFGQFKEKIGQQTSPVLAELAAGRFSGTNTDAAVAFDITLMAGTKEYFDFWGSVMCGIPEITIEGSPEDWQQVEERFAKLEKYELEWWVAALKPILAQFTRASKGDIDRPFWKNMVKIYEKDLVCATEDHPTGWVLNFFPYIKDPEKGMVRNPILSLKEEQIYKYLSEKDKNTGHRGDYLCDNDVRKSIKYNGPDISDFSLPEGVSTCTLNVDNNGDLRKMSLNAGFVGMRQDPSTKALRPVIGWAVIDTGEKPDPLDAKRYEKHKEKSSGH